MSESDFETMPPDVLWGLTIYGHPDDYPEGFIVRRWYVPRSHIPGIAPEPVHSPIGHRCATLTEAREVAVQLGGSYPIPRLPGDVPCIVEVWL